MALPSELELDLGTPYGALFFLAKVNELDGRKRQAEELYQRIIDLKAAPEGFNRLLVLGSFVQLHQMAPEEDQEDIKRLLAIRMAQFLDADALEKLGFLSDEKSFSDYLSTLKAAVGDNHPSVNRVLVIYHLARRRQR